MAATKTNALVIRTAEGIAFPLLLASPVMRFLAWAVDAFTIAAIGVGLALPLSLLGFISPDLAIAAWMVVSFIVGIGYGMVLEWQFRGQTLGKRLLGLRVVDAQGLRLQFSQIVIRNLLRFVDFLPGPYLVGGVACLLSRRGQRLGDLAANTIVTRHPRISEPDLEQMLAGKFNSFREHPHLAARLRQRVTPDEAGVALHALLRRDELDPEARVRLFASIAGHFRGILHFPQEATDGITDEQYVRNVVDVLFRTSR